MCIIVYKPTFELMPKKEILKNAFINNDDGCGFMCVLNGKVHIEKGFMEFDSFYRALKKYKDIWSTSPFVLHFRISTQGGVNKKLTHPFPLSSRMKNLKKLVYDDDFGVAHNGIISLTSTYDKNIKHSDTMLFITEYLSRLIKHKHYYKDADVLYLIGKLADSKLAILDSSGHCELIGDFIHDDGIYYSNTSYRKTYYSSYGCYSYDFDDDESYLTNNDVMEKLMDDLVYYYDEHTGKYCFDINNCPLMNYGTYKYCDDCSHFDECY